MSTIAFDQFALTRIADFARSLSRLHQASRRQPIDDDAIDREFNAVCMSVWGYTTDDFSDELFSIEDHAWLDTLDEAQARIFAAEQGYDLVDDNGMLTDWWGYCWMILAEKRDLLTPEYATSPLVVAMMSPGRSEVSSMRSTGANPAGSRPLQVQSARSALRKAKAFSLSA